MSPLRGTCKSTGQLALALTRAGHPVSDTVVGEMLRASGYSLQANAKVREGGGVPDEQMLGDVTGAIDFLRSQPHASGKVGVIGFCSGGRQTYLVACKLSHLVQGAVDCWGGNVVVDDKSRLTKAQPVAPHDLTEGIDCPVLGLFGNEDPNPSADQVNRNEAELKRLGKNYEFHRYDGAGHAFFAHYRPNYRVDQAIDGWHKVFAFFHKHLGAPAH